MIDIKNGDCLELMPHIPPQSVDMILCDLPYGSTKNKWDTIIPFDELWEQYNRIITNNGVIALFCDGLFMANLMLSNTKMWRYNLIWNKNRGCDFLNANVKPLKSHEEIAIFYKKSQCIISNSGIVHLMLPQRTVRYQTTTAIENKHGAKARTAKEIHCLFFLSIVTQVVFILRRSQ